MDKSNKVIVDLVRTFNLTLIDSTDREQVMF